jgi:ATP-dependent exoDNAse (exonuclease V) alpha subunit
VDDLLASAVTVAFFALARRADVRGAGRQAKVVLAGDPAQLSSVDSGGMFRTLVRDQGENASTLEYARRFKAAWEKPASLQMRR